MRSFLSSEQLLSRDANGFAVIEISEGSGDGSALREVRRIPCPAGRLSSFTLGPDGDTVCARTGYADLTIIDMDQPNQRKVIANGHRPHEWVELAGHEPLIALGEFNAQGTRVWDWQSGELLHESEKGNASVRFAPGGEVLLEGRYDEVRVRSLDDWSVQKVLPRSYAREVPAVQEFSGDGRIYAMNSSANQVSVYDPADWTERYLLAGPDSSPIRYLAFSDAGERLAICSDTGLTEVWDLDALGAELAALGFPSDLSSEHLTAGVDSKILGMPWRAFVVSSVLAVVLVLSTLMVSLARYRRLLEESLALETMARERAEELRVAQEQLQHSQKMEALGTLAAGVAHDFNNLLSVIRMANRLSLRETRELSEVQENLEMVEQAVRQGKLVVDSMLGYSRGQEGEAVLFSVAEVVEDVLPLLNRQFLRGIRLSLKLMPNLPLAEGIPGRLQQVLLNLIVNAAEAIHGEGSLELSVVGVTSSPEGPVLQARESAEYVKLSVRDSGHGMSEEVQQRIFDPFFSTKAPSSKEGSGLGLSVVYRIAKEAGWGLEVDSAPGRGATFSIWIPACEPNAQ